MARHKQRRTYTAGKVPTTAQILEGELVINVPDGKMYTKIVNGGSESVVQFASTTDFDNILGYAINPYIDISGFGYVNGEYVRCVQVAGVVFMTFYFPNVENASQIFFPNFYSQPAFEFILPITSISGVVNGYAKYEVGGPLTLNFTGVDYSCFATIMYVKA